MRNPLTEIGFAILFAIAWLLVLLCDVGLVLTRQQTWATARSVSRTKLRWKDAEFSGLRKPR